MRLATIDGGNGSRAAVWMDGAYIDIQATSAELPSSVREIVADGKAKLEAKRFQDSQFVQDLLKSFGGNG